MPWSHSALISAGTPSMRYSLGMPTRLPLRSLDKSASHCGTGRSSEVESLGSNPAIASSRIAQSRTVLRHRPGLVERAGEGDDAPARAAAVGRLDPANAGEGRRLADRAAGVGAGDAGRDAAPRPPPPIRPTSRPGSAPTLLPLAPPRADHRAVGAGLVRRAHRELVHVELAEHPRAAPCEIGGDGAFVGRLEALRMSAPGGGVDALGGEQVLDAERNAGRAASARRRAAPASAASAAASASSGVSTV